MPGWAAAVPAIAEGIGSLLGFGQASKAERRAAKLAQAQFQFQQDMAKNSVQWRVADAKAAGIHPLAALGIMPSSFAPVSMGGDGGASHLADLGQNIGRAVGAYQSSRERAKQVAVEAAEAARRRKMEDLEFEQRYRANEIDIAVGAAQLARLNAPGSAPPLNVGPGVVSVRPARTTSPAPGNLGREAGAIRDYGYTNTDEGGLAIVPSFDVHERIEDNMLQQFGWALRNQVAPVFGGLRAPSRSEHPLPPGFDRWKWSSLRQQFLPFDSRSDEYLINGRRHPAYGGRWPVGRPRR